MRVLFDTNILIDYLKGIDKARKLLRQHRDAALSVITRIEVLVGAQDDQQTKTIKAFLARWPIIELNSKIADLAVAQRRSTGMRLPDAVIWATAKYDSRILLTRNTKDFSEDDPLVRVPYTL